VFSEEKPGAAYGRDGESNGANDPGHVGGGTGGSMGGGMTAGHVAGHDAGSPGESGAESEHFLVIGEKKRKKDFCEPRRGF
jgi:hypothetical protein